MNDTEKSTLQSTYSGLTFNYDKTPNGMNILNGHVAVYYKGIGNIVEDSFTAVETFCNEVDGG